MTRFISDHNPAMPQMKTFVDNLTHNGVPADSEVIYRGRNTVFTTAHNGSLLNIKAFKKPSAFNAIVYTTLRKSKAHRSYLNALELIRLGFNTPLPVGYGEEINGLKLGKSYYVSEQIDAQNIRNWEDKPDCDALLKALAAEMARLHKAGVWHKDFSGGNILYTFDAQKGYTFYYVDLNRMQFGIKSRRKLMSMFRDMNHSAAETERIARYYAQETGQDPEIVVREALEAHNECVSTRQRKQRFKRLFKRAK